MKFVYTFKQNVDTKQQYKEKKFSLPSLNVFSNTLLIHPKMKHYILFQTQQKLN